MVGYYMPHGLVAGFLLKSLKVTHFVGHIQQEITNELTLNELFWQRKSQTSNFKKGQ